MKKLILMGAIGLGALSFQACNNQNAGNDVEDSLDSLNEQPMVQTTDDGAEFLTETASGGMMEVELAKLAQERSQNLQVKEFAGMIIKDHSAANDELKQLAMTKNISLPDAPLPEQQETINNLKEKTGAEFDKEYVDIMVSNHKNDVDEFQEAADDIEDGDIKAFAAKTLPVLRGHLDSIQKIQDSIK